MSLGVNFINISSARFSYKSAFPQLKKALSYKKCVRKMLVKLTLGRFKRSLQKNLRRNYKRPSVFARFFLLIIVLAFTIFFFKPDLNLITFYFKNNHKTPLQKLLHSKNTCYKGNLIYKGKKHKKGFFLTIMFCFQSIGKYWRCFCS